MTDQTFSRSLRNTSCGLSKINSSTNEDRYYVNFSHKSYDNENVSSFGIFDGHGGDLAANFCAQSLHESIIQTYRELENNRVVKATRVSENKLNDKLFCEAIRMSFKYVDKAVKLKTDAGTTSVSIFVMEQLDGSTRVICPWVGDSKCVMYQALVGTTRVHAVSLTYNHVPSLPSEAERIGQKAGIIWTGKPHELGYGEISLECGSRSSACTMSLTDQSFDSSNDSSDDAKENSFTVIRCDETYEDIKHVKEMNSHINTTEKDSFIEGNNSSNVSFIDRRGRDKTGPLAVFTNNGISLCMTRSIGDRCGPKSCVWVPDISAVTIPAEQHARIVLATDGLWDVMSVEAVQALVYRYKSARRVACLLSRKAYSKRMNLQMREDDITILIVDINMDCYQQSVFDMSGCIPKWPNGKS